jgi:hypothetical protein
MATPFRPAAGPGNDPAGDPRRTTRAAPSGDGPGRRTPLVLTAIALIAAGAVLLWLVTGTVAGIDTDAIGVAAIALGGIALMARLVALRQSHDRHGPSVP